MPSRDTLWDLAINQVEDEEKNAKLKREEIMAAARSGSKSDAEAALSGSESHVLFMGSKNSGKTSLILRFLEKNESPKPTTALEYTFGRKSKGPNLTKDVGHIWELGGGTSLSQLLTVAIKQETVANFSLILVVDLSQPNTLWNTVEIMIQKAKEAIESACIDPAVLRDKREQAMNRTGEQHQDKDLIDPFPCPLVIVGMKYDIFQEFDTDKKKLISKTLRFLAHNYGAALMFCSSKNDSMMNKAKIVIGHFAFGTVLSLKPLQLEYNKPLCISFGADALESIGFPPVQDVDIGKTNARSPLELWKQAFTSYFPQESISRSVIDDPSKDPQYREAAVDNMRSQKDKELSVYKKKADRKLKSKQITGPMGDAGR